MPTETPAEPPTAALDLDPLNPWYDPDPAVMRERWQVVHAAAVDLGTPPNLLGVSLDVLDWIAFCRMRMAVPRGDPFGQAVVDYEAMRRRILFPDVGGS
jgi:hypothetical protein